MASTFRTWWAGLGRLDRAVMCAAVMLATLYGGSKSITSRVDFPRTDPEVAYLVDAGSYVSNDVVRVAFNTYLLPSSAMIYVDAWPKSSTDPADVINVFSAPLFAFPRPLDIEYPGAISNRWICYTDWTPGSVVHTNGVFEASWMSITNNPAFAVPKRTAFFIDDWLVWPDTNLIQRVIKLETVAPNETTFEDYK